VSWMVLDRADCDLLRMHRLAVGVDGGVGNRRSNVPRRVWLPITNHPRRSTVHGLLVAAFLNLAWAGLTDFSQWWGAAGSFLALCAVMRWG